MSKRRKKDERFEAFLVMAAGDDDAAEVAIHSLWAEYEFDYETEDLDERN